MYDIYAHIYDLYDDLHQLFTVYVIAVFFTCRSVNLQGIKIILYNWYNVRRFEMSRENKGSITWNFWPHVEQDCGTMHAKFDKFLL